ncbi:MAG: DNA gyrase subunit A [Phycisphaerales bacterium]|jgi:DNA gyrase subunit A|nr:DNA gyrase subunit A [Phycisphaerales bacterium]
MSDTPEQNPEAQNEEVFGNIGNVVDQLIESELHDSYLTYAMSTIMDRALPDVRDGLKPSQRRILVAMHDLNLSPGRKHRKCAKIAGDTSGNYHPHGESVIYPTLVNMGQNWKMRVMLVDKQGNFGSIDGDPPAAMRYTEARMTHAAVVMLDDIKLDTVDFKPNYDETRQEPTVLPARLPNLLVNGSSGIAVGMSCSMPPHNVGDICDAIIATIDTPEMDLTELLELVPGPDFPTGGVVVGKQGLADAYATGRGKLQVRGRVHHETIGKREAIVIDEIPYQLVQNNLIEKIVDCAKTGRIAEISDIKNFSGKKWRTRIVVYLKRGADPEVVERQLYKFTPLQSTVSIINIALVNGRPQTLSLRALIDCWVGHRQTVIRRRTEYLLREASKAAHRLEGLIYAVCDIDEVIALIRGSRTREEAIEKLMAREFCVPENHEYSKFIAKRLIEKAKDGVSLSKFQAEAIGALRLIQLVGLEIEKLTSEYAELLEKIDDYEAILSDEQRILDIIREDCVELKEKFATDRLTGFVESEDEDFDYGALIPEHDVCVTISHHGYVKRLPIDTFREQGRGGRGVKGGETKDDDFIEHIFVASTHEDLLCFTDSGRVFQLKVYQIPEATRTSRGRAIVNLLNLKNGENIVTFRSIKDFETCQDNLVFATSMGRVKRTSVSEYRNVNRGGIHAIKLNEGDTLVDVIKTDGQSHILLGTSTGMSIRFVETDARLMGRTAAGVKGINLSAGDKVVGAVLAEDDADLMTMTENGFGKRTPMLDYLVHSEDGSTRAQSRGGKGRRDIQTGDRNGFVADIRSVRDSDSLMFITANGMLVRISASDIRTIGRNTKGVRVVNLKDDDRLIAAAKVEGVEDTVSSPT